MNDQLGDRRVWYKHSISFGLRGRIEHWVPRFHWTLQDSLYYSLGDSLLRSLEASLRRDVNTT